MAETIVLMMKRINYIDGIKGFTILAIVFNHIRIFSLEIEPNTSAISMFIVSFMVPMFFFVSGFVNKIELNSSIKDTCFCLLKKFRTLILPTLAFWGISRIAGIYEWGFPGGFWFTFTLFEMFVLQYVISAIPFSVGERYFSLIFLTFSILLLATNIFGDIEILGFNELRNNLIYFSLGFVCKSLQDKFDYFIHNQIYIAINILIATALLLIQYNGIKVDFFPGGVGIVWTIKALSMIFLIFSLFNKYSDYWDSGSLIPKTIRYLGGKTLDIYILHFFFLPSVPVLSTWFECRGNSVIEFMVIGIIMTAVIILSLAVSTIINTSSFVSYFVLGGRKMIKV